MKRWNITACLAVSLLFISNSIIHGKSNDTCPSPYKLVEKHKNTEGKIDIKGLWGDLKITSDVFFSKENPLFKADIISLNTGNNCWDMIRLTNIFKDDCQFLFFRLDKDNNWHFAGQVDRTRTFYQLPNHRVVEYDGFSPWFVVNNVASEGTGILLKEESWYLLSDKGVERKLNYLTEGHWASWDRYAISFEFHQTDIQEKTKDNKVIVTYNLKYEYQMDKPDFTTLIETNIIKEYSFNTRKRSGNIQKEKIADTPFPVNSDQFVETYGSNLVAVAGQKKNDEDFRKWFQGFIDTCHQKTNKKKLRTIFEEK
ncbi:MAG: hypothetical protein PHR77_04800 [Kiritimatiellae bacterium]|nr:hypothetical protein [Kiritimatiellia bacterium]MDD5519453.1 hypothetical protein [Kiritimatiellia bacterium]